MSESALRRRTVYHTDPKCKRIRTAYSRSLGWVPSMQEIPMARARAEGLRPCPLCVKTLAYADANFSSGTAGSAITIRSFLTPALAAWLRDPVNANEMLQEFNRLVGEVEHHKATAASLARALALLALRVSSWNVGENAVPDAKTALAEAGFEYKTLVSELNREGAVDRARAR